MERNFSYGQDVFGYILEKITDFGKQKITKLM
jgi:hypothetical protein